MGLGSFYMIFRREAPIWNIVTGECSHPRPKSSTPNLCLVFEQPRSSPALTDVAPHAIITITMNSNRAFFFYAYFYGAPKAAVASR
jgi:hypothetical protein